MPNIALPELAVMQNLAEAVACLTPAEKRRVASWLSEYVQLDEQPSVPAVVQETVDVAGPEESADAATDAEDIDATEVEVSEPVSTSYESFADLYDDVAPKTGTQKAVTAGYWFEVKEGKQSWKASEVNKLLKSIDVKVSSISIVLTNAVKAKKPLIAQLERLGDSERSRKTFCLKESGIEYVESRIA